MSMNKDLVSQAVSAIPLWMAFLDKKEAEQDELLKQMQGTKKPNLMQQATSLLKKPKKQVEQVEQTAHNESGTNPNDEIRWAPTSDSEQEIIADLTEEQEKEVREELEKKRLQNLF